jgi:hypothetical protein
MWLALCGGLSAVGLMQLLRIRRRALGQAPSDAADALLLRLLRVPPSHRVAAALRHAQAGSWEWMLADAVARSATPFDRIDVISEQVADLDRSLDVTRRWLPVGAHAALLMSVLLAVVGALLERLPEGLLGAGLSGVAALAALGAERRFTQVEAAKRLLVDRLVTALQSVRAEDSDTFQPADVSRLDHSERDV